MKSIFEPDVTDELIRRIRALSPDSQPEWGRMDVARMLAHCCVPFEITFDPDRPRPNAIKRFFLRLIVKPGVVGEKPYPKGSPTAPEFRIPDERDFHEERDRLIGWLERCRELGPEYFEGLDYPNFGPLTAREWSTLFHKHLDHHLTQFGV